MCGRLSQYHGIHDFVAALSIPNALINYAGDQPLACYNAAPTTQLALFHRDGEYLRADRVRWGWRPHWAKDRVAPINARVEKVAHGPFFKAIWPHRAIIAIDNWFEWVYEGGPKKQPYLIRHRDRSPIFCAAIGQYPIGEHEPGEHDGFVIITKQTTANCTPFFLNATKMRVTVAREGDQFQLGCVYVAICTQKSFFEKGSSPA
jgi:putative SOS response-associated peptidase YedK